MKTRIFIHGLEGSNKGTKARFFKQRYPDMIIPHFKGDLDTRMDLLTQELSGKDSLIIIGSSFGGLMGSLFALDHPERIEKLILLAPAINFLAPKDYEAKVISVPVWIFHGTHDEVIPINAVKAIAYSLFSNLDFNQVDDDHVLSKTFKELPWDQLLS